MQIQVKSKKRIGINITSLIDVLFLLLLFFVISSTFLEQPGMKLELPKSSQKEAVKMEGYTLFISPEERIFLNNEPVPLSDLPEKLKTVSLLIGEQGIILKADQSIRYGLVVEVMDVIKQSGIPKIIVATELKESVQ
ncbi:biopolymer transporter ExbD [bacterium]|nr:biopolymer transporter ExbD [bacterium]